jgi:hypothetical protein
MRGGKQVVIHVASASETFMTNHHMLRMSHPPYSCEMAPSDFYLFGTVKNRQDQFEELEAKNFFEGADDVVCCNLERSKIARERKGESGAIDLWAPCMGRREKRGASEMTEKVRRQRRAP